MHGIEANLALLDCILIPSKIEILINGKRRKVWATPRLVPGATNDCAHHKNNTDLEPMNSRLLRSSIDSGYSRDGYPIITNTSSHFTTPIDDEGFKVHLASLQPRLLLPLAQDERTSYLLHCIAESSDTKKLKSSSNSSINSSKTATESWVDLELQPMI